MNSLLSSLSHFNFLSPWLLAGLISLPAIWYLLKITPPAPKTIKFGPLHFLEGLVETEKSAAHTPLWLLLLRMALITLLIIAFAGPYLNQSDETITPAARHIIVIDNSWSSVDTLALQKEQAVGLARQNPTTEQVFYLLKTTLTADERTQKPDILSRTDFINQVNALESQPWNADIKKLDETLKTLLSETGDTNNVFYLDDGVQSTAEREWIQTLKVGLTVYTPKDRPSPILLAKQQKINSLSPDSYVLKREEPLGTETALVTYHALDGQILGTQTLNWEADSQRLAFTPDMPEDVLYETARLSLHAQNHAGAVYVLPPRPARLSIGLIGFDDGLNRNFLDPYYYIRKALMPYHKLVNGNFETLKDTVPVMILAQSDRLTAADTEPLMAWVKAGGILIRFADEGLASGQHNTLVPVPLRQAGRSLESALSWQTPQTIRRLADNSPFAGLAIPEDVTIRRQILAEPSLDLPSAVWAEIQDGTPLVTAKTIDKGLIVLYHVGANPDWSNLPLSGLFIEQLLSIIDRAQATPSAQDASSDKSDYTLQKRFAADGTGLSPKGFENRIKADNLPQVNQLDDRTPPGVYSNGTRTLVLNLGDFVTTPQLSTYPPQMRVKTYETTLFYDFRGVLLVIAFALLALDTLWRIGALGAIARMKGRHAVSVWLLMIGVVTLFMNSPAFANDEMPPQDLASHAVLAYVKTGNPDLDNLSEAGLRGLIVEIQKRTSADVAQVKGIRFETDDLSFYPLIYWPIDGSQPPVSPRAAQKIADYMAKGGMILIDTRDGYQTGMVNHDLKRVTTAMSIPTLIPLPTDHVLRRSFYLLNGVPGLYDSPDFWMAPVGATVNDGVAPLLIGPNDWASAWAINPQGLPAIRLAGGERQREMAYRFGINLVLYTLTGNYKDDQIHIPFILDRLDQ